MKNDVVFVVATTLLLLLFGAITAAVLETESGRILIAATCLVLVARLITSLPRPRRRSRRVATPAGTNAESPRSLV